MQAHPRLRSTRSGFSFWRFATSFAMLTLVLLATGTVYAQSALPGDSLYAWKRASENVWRAVSPDPVRTDLAIANRRIDEMNAVVNDPVRSALALQGYQEVLVRLQAELDAETLADLLPPLETKQEPIEPPDQLIPALPVNPTGTSIPILPLDGTVIPPQTERTEAPLPNLPESLPTTRPEIVPTIEIPPLLP